MKIFHGISIRRYIRLGREARLLEKQERWGEAADKYGEMGDMCINWIIFICCVIIVCTIARIVVDILAHIYS